MTRKLRRDEIIDYQSYAEQRDEIREAVMDIKRARRIHVGEHLTFLFENAQTMRYQVQEMMRVEEIVKESAIAHELETYNEVLGGEGELGCSLLIEIDDPVDRRAKLTRWLDLPRHLYVELADGERVAAKFDPRQVGEDRLSAVQYIQFGVGGQAPVAVGCDHPEIDARTELNAEQRAALLQDLLES